MIFGLDPSSVRTGWAVIEAADEGKVQRAGYFEPRTAHYLERTQEMCRSLLAVLNEFPAVTLFVIEITSGHVNTRRHFGGGAGLAKYGTACGVLYAYACIMGEARGFDVLPVEENAWTMRRSKDARRAEVAMQVPEYRKQIANDAGGDIADAVCLAWYGLKRAKHWRAGVGVYQDWTPFKPLAESGIEVSR